MKGISAVIITKNEEVNIKACVDALKPVVDEVLVIDSGSVDQTIAIAESAGAKVLQTEWKGYSATKNWGNQQAKNKWILSIDADEVLSKELQQSIVTLEEPTEKTVFILDRITNYCGKWIHHSGWYPDQKVRLFDKEKVYWKGDYVHETLHIPTEYSRILLKGKLEHYSYKSLEDHWQRLNKYAELSAQEMFNKGKKASWIKLNLAPAFRFFRTLILKKGILDGKEGLIISKRNAYMVRKKYRLLNKLNSQKND